MAVARVLEIDPELRISSIKERLGLTRSEYLARLQEGVRKAGLHE
jgi:hypothetical protein